MMQSHLPVILLMHEVERAGGNVTFEARLLVPSSGASLPGAIVAKNQQPGGEYWIRVQSDGTVTFLWDDGGTQLTVDSTTAIDDDQWNELGLKKQGK